MPTTQSTSQLPVSRPDSTFQTPALTPSNSVGPSPAFTVLQSPAVSEFDLEDPFDKIGCQDDEVTMPECWGHRGASASFPENTIASFVEACKAGADGIETDIHMTTDDVLVMFHDPELHRTTDGEGRIDKLPWKGVLEHVRTLEKPHQPIPQFTQVIDLLLQPENSRVKINLDLKVENDPVRLFGLIKSVVESYEGWQKKLAPRIVLGIWHPKFVVPATTILPYLPRYAISMDIPQCRKYFFNICHGFSIRYEALATSEGAKFRQECKAAGKKMCSWTVNDPEEMRQCARWGIASVISDKPDLWRKIRLEIETDRAKALKPTFQSYISPFFKRKNWWFDYQRLANEETEYLEREAGTFDVPVPRVEMHIAAPEY
ncbi:glycerophosphodiesterase [Cryptococcus deuterogattii LA55]|nr:glycerophosphodiesterase [Cryptococcus deuterogattii LA55]KIR93874.1 glycerophosphodiesterase [Cryptococcus deuterogattii CBS 10090]KIS00142.1 glycerophosphodiesterase [Cryptococcus deuterogattii 2001/935-1]